MFLIILVNALETVFYPTNKIRLPVDKENVIKSGTSKRKRQRPNCRLY